MKNFRAVFALASAALFIFSACGNNTTAPASTDSGVSASAATAATSRLAFSGKADAASVSIAFFDDYLEKMLDGNNYAGSTGVVPTGGLYILPFEMKITGLSYYNTNAKIDVTCAKDINVNKIIVALKGSLPNGHEALYGMSSDGTFYACDTAVNSNCTGTAWVPQGPQDEITRIEMLQGLTVFGVYAPYNPTFECKGSDGNDYTVALYGDFDYQNLSVHDTFDIKTSFFKGAVSVKLKNYNDNPLFIYVQ
ncbi:MAG: hypothetical protein WCQ53_02345 [bacterium]